MFPLPQEIVPQNLLFRTGAEKLSNVWEPFGISFFSREFH